MFRRLRTKLAVLFGGLFGAGLVLMSIAAGVVIIDDAENAVRGELTSGAAVFDRLWTLRSDQLRYGAGLLAQDFGFRRALATRDAATIGSAVGNLRARLGLDLAYVIGADGAVVASDGQAPASAGVAAAAALQDRSDASGVLMIGDTPYQTVSAPIMAPNLIGWVVFASKLDRARLASIERLSAIPLEAAVLHRGRAGRWSGQVAVRTADRSEDRFSRLVDQALRAPASKGRDAKAQKVSTPEGQAIALVRPLAAMDQGQPIALVLSYPLARALAPYWALLGALVVVGILGASLLVLGAWALADTITRPIRALDEAVHRLQRGEDAEVTVGARDEIGRLSTRFNQMASEIRERERRITHMALHDPSTDLPNRRAMELALTELTASAGEERVMFAALACERFNEVRAAFGYGLANALVGGVGARLIELHPSATVARVTTDVIGLAFTAAESETGVRMVSDLLGRLEGPLRLGDNTVDVGLTAGLAELGVHADAPDSLVERAVIAVDQARMARRKIAAFDAAAYGDPASNLSLIGEMLQAMDSGGMQIHLQPKCDLRTGDISGAEVLVRWRHPTRGFLSPDLFVGMAEETGHIRQLTEWVLARAIQEQAALKTARHDLELSVNLSGRLLSDPEFAELAIHMIRSTGARICLEITETAVMDNPELALELIARFSEAGIGISIDDYGAGLSSLAYLKRIAADELKIDKSFVLAMTEGGRDALLVRSTIDLAHSLGMKVTAEGVETEAVLALLGVMGCDLAQGYLIARPMPLADVIEFLDSRAENGGRGAPQVAA